MIKLNTPIHLPSIRPLFRWRVLRVVFFVGVCLVTLVGLFYAEEDVRGKHAWNAYVREQAGKGEKFSLAAFIPPAVPDDQNLALCPLLRPILDFNFEPVPAGQKPRLAAHPNRWRDTNGWNRAQRLDRTWSVSEYHAHHQSDKEGRARANTAAELSNRLTSKPLLTNGWIDLVGWQAYYRTGTNLAGVEPAVIAANDVLFALRHLEPDLAELQREAERRPLSRWAIYYETNAPWGILLPHLARGKGIVALLQLRSAARLAAGDTAGAVADVDLGFRIAESYRDEPFLISHLVRNACCQLLLQPLKEGLVRHQFSDAQLLELQKTVAAVDLLAAYQYCLRAERGWNSDWNLYAKQNRGLDWESIFGSGDLASSYNSLAKVLRFAPAGWIYQSQVTLMHLHDQFAFPAVDVRARRVHPEMAVASEAALDQLHGLCSLLPRALFPDLVSLVRKFAHDQNQLDDAVIGCALERYHLVHRSYPETLDALVPAFITNPPHDLLSGQPLQYHRTEGGLYSLESTEWKVEGAKSHRAQSRGFEFKVEDWTWRLPGEG